MQVEIQGHIHAKFCSWAPDKPEFEYFEQDDVSFLNSKHCTYVMVKTVTITADVGDFKADYRELRIAALTQEETKLRADYAKRCAEIKDEIQKLAALSFDPAAIDSSAIDSSDIPF